MKIKLVETKIKDFKGGDHVVYKNRYNGKFMIARISRGITFIHKHKYIEVDLDYESIRYYDYDTKILNKIVI